MTQTAEISLSLLRGDHISIMDAYHRFACTNLPREISRSIEQKFRVKVDREKVVHVTQYKRTGIYYRYSLPNNEHNKEGIQRMIAYIQEVK